jgi:hypothetical protein
MTINTNKGKTTMYYYLIPIAILIVVAVFGNKQIASPFASRQVNDICAHMTKAERRASNKIGALVGLCLAAILSTLGFIIGSLFFKSALTGMTVCFALFPFVILILILLKWCPTTKWQQSFLASTEWAKSEGIEANDIKLFRWNQK